MAQSPLSMEDLAVVSSSGLQDPMVSVRIELDRRNTNTASDDSEEDGRLS